MSKYKASWKFLESGSVPGIPKKFKRPPKNQNDSPKNDCPKDCPKDFPRSFPKYFLKECPKVVQKVIQSEKMVQMIVPKDHSCKISDAKNHPKDSKKKILS